MKCYACKEFFVVPEEEPSLDYLAGLQFYCPKHIKAAKLQQEAALKAKIAAAKAKHEAAKAAPKPRPPCHCSACIGRVKFPASLPI